MAQRQSKSQPKWADIKTKLIGFDRAEFLGLVQDLYAAHEYNQTFLHARFGLGGDVLQPYKETIARWLSPDVFLKQLPSVSKGKQAISDYKKAVGEPDGLAELTVFYCERAAGFCSAVGNDDWGYFSSLLSMFERAFKLANTLPAVGRNGLVARLDGVRGISKDFGYGVGEEMDRLFSKYTEGEPDGPDVPPHSGLK